MSHQTGIQSGEGLNEAFSEVYNSESTRMLQVVIEDEVMVLKQSFPAEGDWREDWDKYVLNAVAEREPSYLIYRKDDKNTNGYDFVFIAWSPDFAHIKSKMLYAATRATLKQTFGSHYIKDEVFGTVPEDVSLEGYDRHCTSAAAPPPLTAEELEKAEIRKAETGAEIGASTRRQVATGVAFPIEEVALNKLQDLVAGKLTYVSMSLDLSNETITHATSGSQKVDEIQSQIPDDEPRYHVFNYQHNHEGDNLSSVVFIYSCPGFKCSVKERMMYSTCKGPLIDLLEGDLSVELAKKLEIGEASEFTQEWLYDQLHPAKTVFKQKFSRPSRPGKGGRRLTKK
eukprot:TRINITY_DN12506_c0_g1_i2.p2 TRINITY_DN12506_c0_g1~~TRINITY_DN12506_c0_g1_i2.p2  ORF type:complete len:341 (+),score=75.05 TRINITY_DN12506_c0_g1_i2:2939-3961(+)